ncbi:MAG TPA: polysaccharide biosynthesis tyrosine autokinase [Opitutaceae bacterium]|nr:polysaccharide biosynthesis tyrosine autokinase [Opitutaceae bacterium]
MDSSAKTDKSSGSYPYTYYGASYSGYGAGGHGDTHVHRTFHDYVLILRERVWYIVLVFILVFLASALFTFTRVPQYMSSASIQVLRRDPVVLQVQGVNENEIRSAEDLNTQVKLLESISIIQRVAERLTGEDRAAFLAPYLSGTNHPEEVQIAEIIYKNRKVVPIRLSLVIQVQYVHPDKAVAAKVANLFIDEYIAYNSRQRIEESMKAVDDLKERADQQRKRVEDLAHALQQYREKNNLVSLDQRKDIVTDKLKALSTLVTSTTARLNDAEIRWRQVQEKTGEPRQLLDLPFISNQQLIGQLVQQVAAQKIVLAQLRERYREKHPRMIEAINTLSQTETELNRALASAAAMVEADYHTARRNDEEARSSLAAQESESLSLDRYGVEYTNLLREHSISEHLLQTTLARMKETSMSSTIETQNARVVDRAAEGLRPVSPRIPLNLALGFLGGIALGTAFAFFVAYIDDRVKSSFDIESVIGLPLVGIIPEIKKLEQPEKAQIVVNNQDKQVAEAFLALHSSLRLKDESKGACVILVTSTIPGEGKSFTTTNLALTFAAHGERVVVIDCDLRKPNIHKSFRVENLRGVIDICAGNLTIDDVVMRDVHPNFDIIPAGGRAKNPTQILNSKNFELMISDLRKRYDRVFIDTPPLAAVSDALIVLPLADGSVFTIFFNRVRRKAAQFAARKLLEVNVPCYGAVLNGLNLAVSGYYYAQYYDKSYKDYYVMAAKQDGEEPRESTPPVASRRG